MFWVSPQIFLSFELSWIQCYLFLFIYFYFIYIYIISLNISFDTFCVFLGIQFSSVQLLSHIRLFVTPWTAACQAPGPSPATRAYPNSCPLSRWCHPAISSSVVPFSCPSSFPASGSLQKRALLIRWPKYWSLSFSISTSRADFLYEGLVGSPCNPRDSQESSPTPQFKNINSSVLSFLYSPTLTSIHDYWKNHSFN